MKKITILILILFLLSACMQENRGNTTSPTEETLNLSVTRNTTETRWNATPVVFSLYTPNEELTHFDIQEVEIEELSAEKIVQQLIDANVLNNNVSVLNTTKEKDNLHLDFNAAFRDQLLSYGTSGERFFIGSIVNTFLSVYGTKTITLTVEGNVLESGHVIYDFPLSYME